jgi:small subunit ribosomal protein S15
MSINRKYNLAEFAKDMKNTGSPEFQIALFSYKITDITKHLQCNKKDHQTRRGLLSLVNKRKRLLKYLVKTDQKRYEEIVQRLKIKKLKILT